MTLIDLAENYIKERGAPRPIITNGTKIKEEAAELVEAIRLYRANPTRDLLQDIIYEIGDVAGTIAFIADSFGVHAEDCMIAKTVKDKGRGPGKKSWNEAERTHDRPPAGWESLGYHAPLRSCPDLIFSGEDIENLVPLYERCVDPEGCPMLHDDDYIAETSSPDDTPATHHVTADPADTPTTQHHLDGVTDSHDIDDTPVTKYTIDRPERPSRKTETF